MVARYAIIVARHLTGAKRLMTGCIYNAVIATASCPVLVVPLMQYKDRLPNMPKNLPS